VDSFCCDTAWDNLCVGEVASVCGETCTGAVCGNGAVEAGEQCDDGNTTSGDGCSATCQNEGGACAHDKCDTGVALDATCDPCVAQICAVDPFCCTNSWDSACVGEVSSVCGETCL
jgi:cysteine-rich repeat protein